MKAGKKKSTLYVSVFLILLIMAAAVCFFQFHPNGLVR